MPREPTSVQSAGRYRSHYPNQLGTSDDRQHFPRRRHPFFEASSSVSEIAIDTPFAVSPARKSFVERTREHRGLPRDMHKVCQRRENESVSIAHPRTFDAHARLAVYADGILIAGERGILARSLSISLFTAPTSSRAPSPSKALARRDETSIECRMPPAIQSTCATTENGKSERSSREAPESDTFCTVSARVGASDDIDRVPRKKKSTIDTASITPSAVDAWIFKRQERATGTV